MSTMSRKSFEQNWQTVTHLQSFTEKRAGRTHDQTAAANKAALTFCITVWEAYVEDLVKEAAGHLAEHTESFSHLPKDVRKSIVDRVTPSENGRTKSGKRPQDLADDGWRSLLKSFSAEATEGGNFNTPKTKNVSSLFKAWCGIDVVEYWAWQRFPAPAAAERLDESIEIRGEIIHTGNKPDGLNKNWINTYGENNIKRIVEKTDIAVMAHVVEVCGVKMGGEELEV